MTPDELREIEVEFDLPDDWTTYVDPSEIPGFVRVSSKAVDSGHGRAARLVRTAVRLRRRLRDRYGENWHQRRAGDSW